MKMLLIDDSRTMRNFLGALAADLAIDTEQAKDGLEALERLKTDPHFEVALVDWDMPRMNGLEFVRAVRKQPEYDGLKLMMLTSHNTLDDIRAALSSGANEYLMKPVTHEALTEKLTLLGVIDS